METAKLPSNMPLLDDNNIEVAKRSQISYIWFRFKKNKLAMIGLFLLIIMAVVSFGSVFFYSYQDVIVQDVRNQFAPPGTPGHLLGTDNYGRDMLGRLLYGGRLSLSMGFGIVSISLLIGGALGAISGYYGGRIDNLIMRVMDVFLAIPQIMMAMAIVAVLGSELQNLLIAMTISNIPKFARIVRSSILQVRGLEYIEAAHACGTGDVRIIAKHIVPNAVGPIIVQTTLQIAQSIIGIAGLSFIGLGVQSPNPEWGTMLSEGKIFMRQHAFLVLEPGIAIMLAVLSFNLVGDGLRDALDPRLKN